MVRFICLLFLCGVGYLLYDSVQKVNADRAEQAVRAVQQRANYIQSLFGSEMSIEDGEAILNTVACVTTEAVRGLNEANAFIAGKAMAEERRKAHQFPPAQLAAEQAKQPQREKLIQDLMSEGLIKNSSKRSSHVHYNVTAKFKMLDYDDKRDIAIAIWSYFAVQTNNKEILLFFDDAVTGKRLGGYSALLGFEW